MKRDAPDGEHYFNRELSWLQFNRRVLEEASNPQNPALERLRFLSIFESNLDEFYMVRVSGLIEQFEAGVLTTSPDGLTPNEGLKAIGKAAQPLRQQAAKVFREELTPVLESSGIRIRRYKELSSSRRKELDTYFATEIFPLCTPIILYPAPSVPFISNRSLNIVVDLEDEAREVLLARVKVPNMPRAIRIGTRRHDYVLLEDIIQHNLPMLFPGVKIRSSHLFRVIRDADVEIRELEAADLMAAIEETLRLRRFGDPVLMEHQPDLPEHIRARLVELLDLDEDDVITVDGLLGMEVLAELAKIDKPALRYPPHRPYLDEELSNSEAIFTTVRSHDVIVHHPYDSFKPVEEFIASSAKDPKVLGVKQTLYRVGAESPIVESLLDAAEAGKQVAAMVELKARFDESNNLVWARQLERAGVHVTYGFAETKTHCKLALLVRREGANVRTFAHIGTGNYNPVTARIYTDVGIFTTDPEICADISELFNVLTGYSKQREYRQILVAPVNLREGLISRIKREIDHKKAGQAARIVWKLNSLVDPEIIDALYEASNAGIEIDLIVRGSCCLRPGVKGMSENIRVLSIIGRFLEHSRIYWFANSGNPDVFVGSADAMRRNFDRRLEVLVPIRDAQIATLLKERLLDICLADNVRAWELGTHGEYKRRAKHGDAPFDSQEWFLKHPISRELLHPTRASNERNLS